MLHCSFLTFVCCVHVCMCVCVQELDEESKNADPEVLEQRAALSGALRSSAHERS